MKPGAHWSTLPKLHAEVAANMDPSLNQRSLFVWMFKCYVLALFVPKLGTQQIGRAAYDPPEEPVATVGEPEPEVA